MKSRGHFAERAPARRAEPLQVIYRPIEELKPDPANDIVLDAFLGSGTTMIAAERTGRRCRGLELDPASLDTAVRRWQTLTGGSAFRTASGCCFDDLARQAEAADAP